MYSPFKALRVFCKTVLFFCAAIPLFSNALNAQTVIPDNGEIFTYTSNEQYTDIQIPGNTTASYLYLEVNGGDGGVSNRHEGGTGATVWAHFKIGAASDEIKPGSKLRLIPGKQGRSHSALAGCCIGAGGGGGSGVLLLPPGETDWEKSIILLVAGGGGGGGSHGTGGAGNDDENGTSGKTAGGESLNNSGSTLNPGGSTGNSSGGAAARKNATPTTDDAVLNDSNWDHPAAEAGYPKGGAGASCVLHGGWGFGGGGSGNQGGGGGGGYSGGGGGDDHGGGGGGSYISGLYAKSGTAIKESGSTSSPQNGYVKYGYAKDATIHLAKNSSKCIDIGDETIHAGSNVQLYDCRGDGTQSWIFDGQMIKFMRDPSQCLEIQGSSPYNGANVELWTCNTGTNAQKWVYDGVKRLIRSARNLDKCLDLVNGQTFNGNNIQMWDCNSIGAQQWLVNGAVTSPTPASLQSIHSLYSSGKCMDLQGGGNGGTANGTNVQLWTCYDGNARQQWYFNGSSIKFNANQNKCLELQGSNPYNGANVEIWTCNSSTNAQKWIYDGLTKTIRSGLDLNKCIHIMDASTTNGANLEIWTCSESKTSQFEIK